jgi:hypothetical protein
MRPFKSYEIKRDEWDRGRRWAVCTTPKASKVVHENDDYLFFWTRAEARDWIADYKSRITASIESRNQCLPAPKQSGFPTSSPAKKGDTT